ncbi:YjcZ family sporulation protein [Halobacillus seohaensis]|uniref:YjcZ family sporulation protein n=1 Tax=Halobacillus seohaensis TaxID=447421 RepID=A0ABW2EM43_9BACI
MSYGGYGYGGPTNVGGFGGPGNNVAGFGGGPGVGGYGGYGCHKKRAGSGFALIVVLFILLIIVGAAYTKH